MPASSALTAVSDALQDFLWNAIGSDPAAAAIISDAEHISLQSPADLMGAGSPTSNYLSFYLFRVAEDSATANHPNRPQPRPTPPALELRLSYLLTPMTDTSDNDQTVVAVTMNALHDSPVIAVPNSGSPSVRVVMQSLTSEQWAAIWRALEIPMRLAVCYEVSPVALL